MVKQISVIISFLLFFCFLGSAAFSSDTRGVRKFTSEEAVQRLAQIEVSLQEYRDFFDLILKHSSLPEDQRLAFYRSKFKTGQKLTAQISPDDIQGISSLDWSTQNIGFPNWVTYINAYLLQQEIELLKKDLEIKILKKQNGQAELKEIIHVMEKRFLEQFAKDSSFVD